MNDRGIRRLECFLRVQEFGRLLSARIPAGSFAAELFTRFTGIINDLKEQADGQSSGLRAAQQSATSKATARKKLLLALRAIARTARAMSLVTPGLADRFRVRHDAKDQELLSIARTILADAAPLAAEFIKRGLPASFLTDLDAAIKLFEQSISQQIRWTESHIAASAYIKDLMKDGLHIKSELDSVMRNLFADDPATLAQWLSASRVESDPYRRAATKKTPPEETT